MLSNACANPLLNPTSKLSTPTAGDAWGGYGGGGGGGGGAADPWGGGGGAVAPGGAVSTGGSMDPAAMYQMYQQV